jgi:hypothetical protein
MLIFITVTFNIHDILGELISKVQCMWCYNVAKYQYMWIEGICYEIRNIVISKIKYK